MSTTGALLRSRNSTACVLAGPPLWSLSTRFGVPDELNCLPRSSAAPVPLTESYYPPPAAALYSTNTPQYPYIPTNTDMPSTSHFACGACVEACPLLGNHRLTQSGSFFICDVATPASLVASPRPR
ncbi:hypothetical protein LX36DRAFT_436900 [Colletotrichum falcatum]|nr:hypothetical protein LX36DRAFT_436900 [Colletotrichum falcatum]